MRTGPPTSAAKLTVVTLGVSDMHQSIAFYEALGFARRMRATGDEVAFFETGGAVLALYSWSRLAEDAALRTDRPSKGFAASRWPGIAHRNRRSTLFWSLPSRRGRNCSSPRTIPTMVAIRDTLRILTAIRGKWSSRRVSRSAQTGGFICRTDVWRTRFARTGVRLMHSLGGEVQPDRADHDQSDEQHLHQTERLP